MPEQLPSIDWTLHADEILSDLLAEVWVPTNAAITVAEIVDAVGKDAARLVIGTLQAGASQDPLLASSVSAISTVGMSLSSIDRQEMIDQLAAGGGWPDAVRDAVKALGGAYVGRWSLAGFDAEPTIEQVQSRQSLLATRTKWNAVSGVVEDRLHTGAITTWAEVVAIVEAT